MSTYETGNNCCQVYGQQSGDDYMPERSGQCELYFPSRHALYHRNLLVPDQRELDFPNRHGLFCPILLIPDEPDYSAWNQQQRFCCNCNGNWDSCEQQQTDAEKYQEQFAHGKRRVSRAHNVKGGEICPVLTSIGTAIAVGVIVDTTRKHVLPELENQYKSHIHPHVNKFLGVNEELEKATTTPKNATKPVEPIGQKMNSTKTKPQQIQNKSEVPKASKSSGGGCSLM